MKALGPGHFCPSSQPLNRQNTVRPFLLFLVRLLLLCASILPSLVRGQGITTQTVRGTVLDAAAKAPIIGATVVVLGVSPALGISTDVEGRFRLTGVPVGHQAAGELGGVRRFTAKRSGGTRPKPNRAPDQARRSAGDVPTNR
jgi:hypothetical protein